MRIKYLLIFLLVTVSIFGGGYFYRKNSNSRNSSSPFSPQTQNEKKEYAYTKTTYVVPVTGTVNKLINISSDELEKLDKVYVLKSEEEVIKNLNKTSAEITIVNDSNELAEKLNNEPTSIGLVTPENLTFKVKTLEIDKHFIFNKKTDLSLYPLKLVEELKSDSQKENESNFNQKKITKFGHTGSMIPARGVQYWTERKFNNDYTHIFQSTKPLFDTFDYLSSTFEISLQGNGRECDHCLSFLGPEKFMDGVKYSGIDFFTMASNHIMDGGVGALGNTQKLLDVANIKYTGASTKNNDDAGKPVLVEVNGLKIAYLGFNDTPGFETWARDDRPGAASISDPGPGGYVPNEERIKYFLQRAKDLKPDMIFVLMHWGHKEYDPEPLAYTKTLANLLTKHGADVILGDHPHIVQEVEFKEDKPVFYCVGNFIFDQMWSTETRQGMTIELNYYGKKLVNFRLHPHQLDLYEKGSVDLLKPEQPQYQQILDRIWSVSNFKNE